MTDRLPVPQTAEEVARRIWDMNNAIASGEIEGIEFTTEMRAQLKQFALGEISSADLIEIVKSWNPEARGC